MRSALKWLCCKCGTENDSGYECVECGTWNTGDYVCSECGSLNDPDDSCSKCGHEHCEDCLTTEDDEMMDEDYLPDDLLVEEPLEEAAEPWN